MNDGSENRLVQEFEVQKRVQDSEVHWISAPPELQKLDRMVHSQGR